MSKLILCAMVASVAIVSPPRLMPGPKAGTDENSFTIPVSTPQIALAGKSLSDRPVTVVARKIGGLFRQ